MQNKKILLSILAILLIILSGCTLYEPIPTTLTCPDGTIITCPVKENIPSTIGLANDTKTPLKNDTIPTHEENTTINEQSTSTDYTGYIENITENTIIVTEGELVKIEPKVSNADEDIITITFSEPLNNEGEWQTEAGDAGEYSVTITASDGKSEAKKDMKIIVKPRNQAPIIEMAESITVKETDMIILSPNVSDPDGDPVSIKVSGWMNTFKYQTDYDDAGEYLVLIIADDDEKETTKTVRITVEDMNRKPEIYIETDPITVIEGETATIEFILTDPDEDEISFNISGFFNEYGEWNTQIGDAGEYTVTLTATDRKDISSRDINITVEPHNKPPTYKEFDLITINVGENVKDHIIPEATDPEGEEIMISYSGWLDDLDHIAAEEDAGEKTILITYSDGANEIVQEIRIDINRPPVFEI